MSQTLQLWISRLERLSYRGKWAARVSRALSAPSSLRVVRHSVLSQRLPPTTPPLRIGFAADFHAGPLTDPRLLTAACEALAASRADLILLGGDWKSRPGCARRASRSSPTATSASLRSVWLCGLDDHWQGRPDPKAAFEGADGMRILLMHAPSGLLDLGGYTFDLALCGHTHGGQIALPGGMPIVCLTGPSHAGMHEDASSCPVER